MVEAVLDRLAARYGERLVVIEGAANHSSIWAAMAMARTLHPMWPPGVVETAWRDSCRERLSASPMRQPGRNSTIWDTEIAGTGGLIG
jgi:hypothetical protein